MKSTFSSLGLLLLTVLQLSVLASADLRFDDVTNASRGDKRRLQDSEEDSVEVSEDPRSYFVTYFDVTYLVNGDDSVDIVSDLVAAAEALVPAYNGLVQDYVNEDERRLEDVILVSAETGRRILTQEDVRQLRNTDVQAFLQSTGSCNGCEADSDATDDISIFRRQLRRSAASTTTTMKNQQYSRRTGTNKLLPGLPTEEELLQAYQEKVQSMNLVGVEDVLSLDEIDAIPTQPEPTHPPTTTTSSKSSKSSSKGTSKDKEDYPTDPYGSKSSKSGSKSSSSKSGSKSSKTGKGGKGKGGSKSSKSGKGGKGKGGSKSSKTGKGGKGKGGSKSSKSGKGKGGKGKEERKSHKGRSVSKDY